MIGSVWYYVVPSAKGRPTTHEIKAATIIGETPRKWILREDDAGEYGWSRSAGDGIYDWTIPKKGEAAREGRGSRGKSRTFFETIEAADRQIERLRDSAWASEHAYRISQRVSMLRDAALLRKIAELIDYKEENPK